jgi:hypothetical protein
MLTLRTEPLLPWMHRYRVSEREGANTANARSIHCARRIRCCRRSSARTPPARPPALLPAIHRSAPARRRPARARAAACLPQLPYPAIGRHHERARRLPPPPSLRRVPPAVTDSTPPPQPLPRTRLRRTRHRLPLPRKALALAHQPVLKSGRVIPTPPPPHLGLCKHPSPHSQPSRHLRSSLQQRRQQERQQQRCSRSGGGGSSRSTAPTRTRAMLWATPSHGQPDRGLPNRAASLARKQQRAR